MIFCLSTYETNVVLLIKVVLNIFTGYSWWHG